MAAVSSVSSIGNQNLSDYIWMNRDLSRNRVSKSNLICMEVFLSTVILRSKFCLNTSPNSVLDKLLTLKMILTSLVMRTLTRQLSLKYSDRSGSKTPKSSMVISSLLTLCNHSDKLAKDTCLKLSE